MSAILIPASFSTLTARCLRRGAFTLVELLGVIAIMLLMFSFAVPLAGDLLASRATDRAAMELSGLMEYARREAMTLQTYTWVAIEEVEGEGGLKELRASVRLSTSGAIDQVTTSSPAGGQQAFVNMGSVGIGSRTFRWPQMKLCAPDELERVNLPSGVVFQSLEGAPASGFATIEQVPGPGGRPRSTVVPSPMHTVTFSPAGMAFLSPIPAKNDPYRENIGIALQHVTRGDEALLHLSGFSGGVRVVR